ncbi:MAG TPA: hypothetical protein VEL07_07280 [Planctomycetota bacterium]|nr:hypothetical protein [Planctomycetota bacterium]
MKATFLLLLATIAAAADDVPLAVVDASDRNVAGSFFTLSEFVVLDALIEVPAEVAGRDWCPIGVYLAALGAKQPPFELGEDAAAASIVRIAPARWLVVRRYRSFVHPRAIAVIDERTASGLLTPPTPAPGADPAQPLVAPVARAVGLTIAAGTARVFCGVRSNGRSLAVQQKDLMALAQLVQVPGIQTFAQLVSTAVYQP